MRTRGSVKAGVASWPQGTNLLTNLVSERTTYYVNTSIHINYFESIRLCRHLLVEDHVYMQRRDTIKPCCFQEIYLSNISIFARKYFYIIRTNYWFAQIMYSCISCTSYHCLGRIGRALGCAVRPSFSEGSSHLVRDLISEARQPWPMRRAGEGGAELLPSPYWHTRVFSISFISIMI